MGLLERWDRRNQRAIEEERRRDRARAERAAPSSFDLVLADGTERSLEVQPSGYPFRFGDGSGDAADLIFVPLIWGISALRHRFQYGRGWTVALLRPRRFWFDEIERLERLPDESSARARADELRRQLSTSDEQLPTLR